MGIPSAALATTWMAVAPNRLNQASNLDRNLGLQQFCGDQLWVMVSCWSIYIYVLVGGIPTPLKNIKVKWEGCSKPPTSH